MDSAAPALRPNDAPRPTPVERVRETYRRLREIDDPGIFLHLMPEAEALACAQALESDGADGTRPLLGLPFAVKDNIDVAGMPTTAGCPAFAYAAQDDSVAVARLRRAGAIPIGKTNLDQFATGLVGTRSPHPVPRNALDPTLVPGGSSSGSAVAVATGIVPFALGTDTAGSGRIPAALNGIVGLKPSLGLVSTRGVVPACRTLDAVSIFARSVAEAHAVLTVAAGFDAADPFSRRLAVRAPWAPPTVRLAVPDRTSLAVLDEAPARAFEATLSRLPALGISVVEIDFAPFVEVANLLYEGPWVAERYTVVADLLTRNDDVVLPVIEEVIGKARAFDAADAFRALYRLKALTRQIEATTSPFDALLVPTTTAVPTLAAVEADPIGLNNRLGTYTNFVNLLDMCAVTVPAGALGGAPAGSVTVLARSGQDGLAAALADRIHRDDATRLGAAPPVPFPAAAAPVAGEMALAAVGAHMSGLPLNHELTARGGRLVRAAQTASDYRLFALPAGPPHRPGLVRVPGGEGAAIAVEVWAMPVETVGELLAGVPAPLAIGTLTLSDGSAVKGFLCEAAAVADARDVTHFGGWRAFLAAGQHAGT